MRDLEIEKKYPKDDLEPGDSRGQFYAAEFNKIVAGVEASELEGTAKILFDQATIRMDDLQEKKADLINEKVDPKQLPDIILSAEFHLKEKVMEEGKEIERYTLNIENLKIALGLTDATPKPAPPIWEFTAERILKSSHVLGSSEILISSDGLLYIPYADVQVDDLAHVAGYRKAKTRALGNRPESEVSDSPAILAKEQPGVITQQLVSTTSYNNHKYGLQDPGFEEVSFFEVKKILVSSKGFQFEFSNNTNVMVDEIPQDAIMGNTVTLKSSCTHNGVVTPLLFNGNRTVVLQPGEIVMSDLIADLTVSANEDISLIHYVIVPAGGAVPVNRTGVPEFGEGYGDYPRNKDYTDSGEPGEIRIGSIFATTGVYATPLEANTDVAVIVADSIGVGEGGTDPLHSHQQLACMAANIPSFSIALRGDQARYFNQIIYSGQRRRYLAENKFTIGLCGDGTNDIQNAGDPGTDTINELHILHQYLVSLGMEVYQSTLLPKTSSSNNWIDLAGQEFLNREQAKNQVNTWIKTNPAPLKGFIDLNTVVESEGKWLTNGTEFYLTVDGVHPSQTCYELMAPVVQQTVFGGGSTVITQLFRINFQNEFNGNPVTPGQRWNNLKIPNAGIAANAFTSGFLLDDAGGISTVKLSNVSAFNGAAAGVIDGGINAGLYPTEIVNSGWEYDGNNDDYLLQLTGLEPNIDIELYLASLAIGSQVDQSEYKAGSVIALGNSFNNFGVKDEAELSSAMFTKIVTRTDGTGSLTFSVKGKAGAYQKYLTTLLVAKITN